MKIKISNLFAAVAIVTMSALVYTGCKKQEDPKPANAAAATDNSNANSAFAGIWKQISTVTDSSNALRSVGCASVTISSWDPSVWPKTVIIDFGTTNCLGNDFNNRRGTITAVFTGGYLDSNTVITVTLNNYYHNDYHIEGTQTITNKGHNSAGHLVYNVIVNNARITSPDGKQSTWNTNQNREFSEGYLSPGIFDDVYLITGTANGVSEAGEPYTITVNSPLKVKVNCHWIVSGTFTLVLGSYPTYPIVFDYGTGGCDANATAVLNGVTYNIVMN